MTEDEIHLDPSVGLMSAQEHEGFNDDDLTPMFERAKEVELERRKKKLNKEKPDEF